MRSLLVPIRRSRELTLLAAAFLLIVVALLRPTIPPKRDIYTYLIVVDITQSMNAEDMQIDGHKTSRIDYTRHLIHDSIASMPCGTRVGVALFAGVVVSTLFHPVEVCGSYDAIQGSIARMEWREAWHGNSRIGFGLLSASAALKALPEPAQVVFFTDGEEAPRLHAFNKADLGNWQGGRGWLLVGIGGNQPTPIPKMDENNKVIGYWSNNTYQLEPGIAQVSEETRGQRDNAVATADYERFLSTLDEPYLQNLAKEIRGIYVRGDNRHNVLAAMHRLKPARNDRAPLHIDGILAALSGLLLILAYLPQHVLETWRRRLARLRRQRTTD